MSPDSPAKYSAPILSELRYLLETWSVCGIILDPFAGTGRIHQLATPTMGTIGVEIEAEWAACHAHTIHGNATKLPDGWTGGFDAVVTSPPYGNRMADNYAGDAKGSRRHTYRIALGRALSPGSAAAMQWGRKYRATMAAALLEVRRVLKPGGLFLLNVSDHVRKGELQRVPEWYEDACTALGFELVERHMVPTARNRHGANGELRADTEVIYVYRKPSA